MPPNIFSLICSFTDNDFQIFKAIMESNLSICCFLSWTFKTNSSICYLKVKNNISPWLTLKTIQVKRSYLVLFWKIPMFFFSIWNKNYTLHINKWGTERSYFTMQKTRNVWILCHSRNPRSKWFRNLGQSVF